MKKRYLFAALILFMAAAFPQSSYTYLSPKPNSILVSPETNIIIKSNSAVNPASLSDGIVTVTGSKSGLHIGKLILSDDNRTIVFNPANQFAENEVVTVSISPKVKTLSGEILPGKTFSFTTIAEESRVSRKSIAAAPIQIGNSSAQYLPAPPITIDTVNNPAPGYIFLATWDRNTPQHVYANYIFILDNQGNIIDSQRVNGAPFDFRVQPNGLLSYGLGDYTGITPGGADLRYYVMDSNLTVLDSFQMKNGYLTDFHDFIMLPNGHAFIMSYTTVLFDMSTIIPGGRTDCELTINIFQEQDANKNVVFEWRDIDYIPIADTDLRLTDSRLNPSTMNAFELDNDGNILFSFRNHSDIMKVSRETGEIMWKWGGLKNEFTFINDHPENAPYYFARQHDIRRLPNGNVSLFDNGEFHSPWYSRAAEYQLDEVNKTATLVSEYRYTPGNILAQAAGNATKLDNGGWFIGYGILFPTSQVKRNIVEVHADGSKAFELSLPNNVIAYRASKQPWKELIQKIKVSKAEVLQGNTYLFNEGSKITGVSVKFNQLSGDIYNSVSITRSQLAPLKPVFFGSAPIVAAVSIIYDGAAITSHSSEMTINLAQYPEIKNPAETKIYMREFPGQGLFLPLATVYNSTSNTLTAVTTKFGEFVFGSPDFDRGLAAPKLIQPADERKILANTPVTLRWSGSGLYDLFEIQAATDSLFTNLIKDTTLLDSYLSLSGLVKDQNYYWRVRSLVLLERSTWSPVWSFKPVDPFVQILSPNGGESYALGDTVVIRWVSNISDSVSFELLQNGISQGSIGKSANKTEAFKWIIPTSLSVSNNNRIKIASVVNTALSDTGAQPFSLTPVGFGNEEIQSAADYSLGQNYPNPFNPSTRILYTIGTEQFVTVKIFDILGNELQTLVQEVQTAGTYSITWNASNLPNGIYYYRLTAGSFSDTKKMLLLK